MLPDELRHLIHAAGDPTGHGARLVIGRAVQGCWPGGTRDRYWPGALPWLTQWHPERLGAVLPACSCASGRCAVCN